MSLTEMNCSRAEAARYMRKVLVASLLAHAEQLPIDPPAVRAS